MRKSIVVKGNLSDGFTFVGPFDSHDEAAASEVGQAFGTWIATLDDPEPIVPPENHLRRPFEAGNKRYTVTTVQTALLPSPVDALVEWARGGDGEEFGTVKYVLWNGSVDGDMDPLAGLLNQHWD